MKVEVSGCMYLWTREEISDFSSTKCETSLTIVWLEGEAIWLLGSLEHYVISPPYSDEFSIKSTPVWAWKTSFTESTKDWKCKFELDLSEIEIGESKICLCFNSGLWTGP